MCSGCRTDVERLVGLGATVRAEHPQRFEGAGCRRVAQATPRIVGERPSHVAGRRSH